MNFVQYAKYIVKRRTNVRCFFVPVLLQQYEPVSKSQRKKITSLWQTEQKKQSKKADQEVGLLVACALYYWWENQREIIVWMQLLVQP